MNRARSSMMVATGISLAVAVGVTGCGAAKDISAKRSAKDSVTSALSGFDQAKSAAFSLTLDTSAADIAKISAAQGDPISAANQAILAKVIGGDVVVNIVAPAGKTLGDSGTAYGAGTSSDLLKDPAALSAALKKSGSSSVQVDAAGSTLLEVRSVGGVIYLKADVKKVLTLAGQDPASLDQALAGLPSSMSAVGQAAKNEWVSVDLAKAAEAATSKGLLKSLPTPAPSASVDPAKLQKLIADLKSAYQSKATISTLGDDATKGTGYRLGAPAKQVALAIEPDLIALTGKSSGAEIKKSIAEIPDKTFNLDLWVKNDKLSAVSLDLAQFLTKPVAGTKLVLNVGVAVDGGSVQVPAGASEIDVKSLLGQLPAGLLSGAATSKGTGAALAPRTLTKAERQQLKESGLTDKQIDQLSGGKTT